MNRIQLNRLKKKLITLRNGVANLKRQDLLSFAESLGRVEVNRGKEGQYVSIHLPYSPPFSIPISIPNHRTFNKYTAGNILDSFERDIFALEEQIENEEERNKKND